MNIPVIITAREIILPPYTLSHDKQSELSIKEQKFELSEQKRFKQEVFLSTPNFIKTLTDISVNVLKAPEGISKKEVLQEELRKLN